MAAAGDIDWRDADLLARLKRRADEGMSARAIAREFTRETGRTFTYNMIVGACQRNAITLRGDDRRKTLPDEAPPQKTAPPKPASRSYKRWTEAEDALIARLYRNGETGVEIARRISAARQSRVTRCAVLGRLDRLGVTKSGASVNETCVQSAKLRSRLGRAPRRRADENFQDPTLKARVAGLPPLAEKRLSDAPHEPVGCRFIEGEVLAADGKDGGWRYCNRAPEDGSRWCPHHRARTTVKKYLRDENAPGARRRQRRAGAFDFSVGG